MTARYIYLMRAGESHYKVGISSNVINRVKAIQTSNPNLVELIIAKPVLDAAKTEHELHKWLAEYKADGGQEWFGLAPENVIDLIIKINRLENTELATYMSMRDIAHRQVALERKFTGLKGELEKLKPKPLERKSASDKDEFFNDAVKMVRFSQRASTSLLQRQFNIGYVRASRLMDELEYANVVSPPLGANKARRVLVSK